MQILIQQTDSVGFVVVEVPEPSADALDVVEDLAGLAAALGTTQADVKRRAFRLFSACVAAHASLPPAKKPVYLTAEEIEAQYKKEREAGMVRAPEDKTEKE